MGTRLYHPKQRMSDEARLRALVASCRETLGDKHPQTLLSINNMALLLKDQGKLAEAEGLCREALTGSRETLGNKHPETLISINNLAALLLDMGKMAEAEPLCQEALAVRRETLGNKHPDTLRSTGNMASLLNALSCLRRSHCAVRRWLEDGRRWGTST